MTTNYEYYISAPYRGKVLPHHFVLAKEVVLKWRLWHEGAQEGGIWVSQLPIPSLQHPPLECLAGPQQRN